VENQRGRKLPQTGSEMADLWESRPQEGRAHDWGCLRCESGGGPSDLENRTLGWEKEGVRRARVRTFMAC